MSTALIPFNNRWHSLGPCAAISAPLFVEVDLDLETSEGRVRLPLRDQPPIEIEYQPILELTPRSPPPTLPLGQSPQGPNEGEQQ